MEKSKATDMFGQKQQPTNKSQARKTAGAAIGGAAVGMAASAFTTNSSSKPINSESTEPELTPPEAPVTKEEPKPEPKPETIPNSHVTDHTSETPEADGTPHQPVPEPDTPDDVSPDPASETTPIPETPPVTPAVEIDPADNDLADVIEDVTTIEVVYDVNGNSMLVATAHNSIDGEFYLVDVDMDGDFDVVLNSAGFPVIELTGENDRLITVTDLDAKITDDYIARNEMDDMIARNDMIGEQIQDDITIIDDGIA